MHIINAVAPKSSCSHKVYKMYVIRKLYLRPKKNIFYATQFYQKLNEYSTEQTQNRVMLDKSPKNICDSSLDSKWGLEKGIPIILMHDKLLKLLTN